MLAHTGVSPGAGTLRRGVFHIPVWQHQQQLLCNAPYILKPPLSHPPPLDVHLQGAREGLLRVGGCALSVRLQSLLLDTSTSSPCNAAACGCVQHTYRCTDKHPPTQSHTQHTTHSENTPGPTTADPYRGTGRQLLSTRHSSPGWGFGTGRRLPDYINDSPGVGSYYA